MRNPLISRKTRGFVVRKMRKHPKYAAFIFLVWVALVFLTFAFSDRFPFDADFSSPDSLENVSRLPAYDDSEFTLRAGGIVRIATWNLKNYTVSNRRVNGKWIEYPKPNSEKKSVVEALKKIDSDVVLVQEIGDAEFMKELRDSLAESGLVYNYCAVAKCDSYARLGILSRLKPESFFDFSTVRFEFRGDNRYSPRGTFGAGFETHGVKWYAFSIHLKSKQGARKSDENFTPFRFAELRAIDAKISSAVGGNSAVVVAGDFNDEPSSALLRNLKTLKLGLVGQADSRGNPHTYFWRKKNINYVYDYFLVSPLMRNYVEGKGRVFTSIENASDHFPVFLDLKFGAAQN